ncbi:MAG: S-methyl-5-thioribose-1-phosphate isomerase [Candidatus Aenigmarchaeota archaeon]|nr:S-methyl-5-thioribose-1-phosphate isomerase [Candidatus Aenigmarchaeota archaeon]
MKVKIDGVEKNFRSVWFEDGKLFLIDQTKLPHKFEIFVSDDYRKTAEAIKNMIVRGAPAIGAVGAYGMVQVVKNAEENADNLNEFLDLVRKGSEVLKNTRPTAVNLFHAIDEVLQSVIDHNEVNGSYEIALEVANKIVETTVNSAYRIGVFGEKLIKNGYGISTHCNAGWLACVDWGTALAPIYLAHRNGKNIHVYPDETRPRNQGFLTAWELEQEGVPYTLVIDNDTQHFEDGSVDIVIVGADRIARNGDVANKIGTRQRAIVAKEYGIPFYVAAPLETFDLNAKSGKDIAIEERSVDEILYSRGLNREGSIVSVLSGFEKCKTRNLAFDVTPAKYIEGIITEKGIVNPDEKEILSLFE